MSAETRHRLSGLEPDNLLAFMALLGLLRVLEEAEPSWLPRVSWSGDDDPPVRPVLHVAQPVPEDSIVTAAGAGLAELADRHRFEPFKDLKLSPEDAAGKLRASRDDRYAADLWAALVSDAATRDRDKKQEAEPTPLCLLFGQGHQHFLERLGSVPQEPTPPARGTGRSKVAITEEECLREALFLPWERLDATKSFRWDPHEDVRYALRATDPTDAKTKETTQHGANRLAAVGLSVLTVSPRRRGPDIRLELLGGYRDHGEFFFTWPIWRAPVSLAAVRALIGHGGLDDEATRAALDVTGRQRARRISSGKFLNFTRAETIDQR